MYESPINKIIGEIQSQLVKDEEGQLMVQVTQAVGYDIDKDELIKAFNYDRQQYEKGYKDGLNESSYDVNSVLDKIRAEIEKVVWEDAIYSFDGSDEVIIPRLDPDDVFEIIDKYKAESEDKK